MNDPKRTAGAAARVQPADSPGAKDPGAARPLKVAFFVTCVADIYFAEAAADAVRLLRSLGCEVAFPKNQSCCGQPPHNAGLAAEANKMIRHNAGVLEGALAAGARAVVVPSGSCAAMMRGHWGSGRDASLVSERTFELSRFIVRELGVTRLGSGLRGLRIALHPGCHALRDGEDEGEAKSLLEGAGGRVVPWEASDECCGFGGLFSAKMTTVSVAMADRKLDALPEVDLLVSGEPACLLQLEGRRSFTDRDGRGPPFLHLATALWRAAWGAGANGGRTLAERRRA